MTYEEFVTEYHTVSARALQLSKKAKKEGLLALEKMINHEKLMQRDILEYGLRFVVDGTDGLVINDILSNIIKQEDDKYTRRLMTIKAEAVLSIQAGDNTRIMAYKFNSFTELSLENDPIVREIMNENDKGRLSPDEIDSLIEGIPVIIDDKTIALTYFDVLGSLDDWSIQKILREIDSYELAKALKSVKKDVLRAVLRNMSKRAAIMLIEDMEYMGPVMAKHVQEAQNHIVEIIRQLETFGEITIPKASQDK
jgi:hypothetical protein